MVIDFLSDMIARLNNGYSVKLSKIKILNSKQNLEILRILLSFGYISGINIINMREIEVILAYYRNQPAIRKIIRISKVKQRVYIGFRALQNRSGLASKQNGFFFLSTSKGIITDIEAISLKIGGELLFQIV